MFRDTLVLSWLPTSSPVPLTATVVPPAMGPNVGVTLLTVGYTAMNESAFTMALLEPIVREKFWGPLVPKLVVIQANWRPGT